MPDNNKALHYCIVPAVGALSQMQLLAQSLRADVQSLSKEVSSLKEKVGQQARQLAGKEEELQTLREKDAEQTRLFAGKEEELQALREKHAVQTTLLADKAETLQEVERKHAAQLAGKEEELQELERKHVEQLAGKEEELVNLGDQVEKLKAENAGLISKSENPTPPATSSIDITAIPPLNCDPPWAKSAFFLLVLTAVAATFATGGLVEAGFFVFAAGTAVTALLTGMASFELASRYSVTIFARETPSMRIEAVSENRVSFAKDQ